jgi:hypothetical protein
MPKGSGNAEAKGRASKLDAGHVELFGWITGWKICSDAKGTMMVQSVMPQEETPTDNYALLKNQQQ